MTFTKRHNKGNKFTFRQDPDAKYIKAKDLFTGGVDSEKNAVRVRGFYINRGGRYGDSPAMLLDGMTVNLPGHMLQEVEEIMASDEDVKDINAGRVGCFAYEYENRNGGVSYGIAWADLPEQNDLPF